MTMKINKNDLVRKIYLKNEDQTGKWKCRWRCSCKLTKIVPVFLKMCNYCFENGSFKGNLISHFQKPKRYSSPQVWRSAMEHNLETRSKDRFGEVSRVSYTTLCVHSGPPREAAAVIVHCFDPSPRAHYPSFKRAPRRIVAILLTNYPDAVRLIGTNEYFAHSRAFPPASPGPPRRGECLRPCLVLFRTVFGFIDRIGDGRGQTHEPSKGGKRVKDVLLGWD